MIQTIELLPRNTTAVGVGSPFILSNSNETFQAIADGSSGAFTATVLVQVSNNKNDWITAGTISLSGTGGTPASDGFTIAAPWKYIRGKLSTISGTGAFIQLVMGA